MGELAAAWQAEFDRLGCPARVRSADRLRPFLELAAAGALRDVLSELG